MDKLKRYNDFSSFMMEHFSCKVQKISINAGFTCPNRDGKKGFGGCSYCNNQTFNPAYCHNDKTVSQQLEEGKAFFAYKYPNMKYLAYFQAYTNTYGELEELKQKYEEALSIDGVVGLVIGTRPDCMPDSLVDYLEELNNRKFLIVEAVPIFVARLMRMLSVRIAFFASCAAIVRAATRTTVRVIVLLFSSSRFLFRFFVISAITCGLNMPG